jgi:hypothetical protein
MRGHHGTTCRGTSAGAAKAHGRKHVHVAIDFFLDQMAESPDSTELLDAFRRTLRSRNSLAVSHMSGGTVDASKCHDAILGFLLGQASLNDTRAQQFMSDLSEAARPSGDDADIKWISAAIAYALPLVEGALPKDEGGVCVLPHHHAMARHEVRSFKPRPVHASLASSFFLFRPLEVLPLGSLARK